MESHEQLAQPPPNMAEKEPFDYHEQAAFHPKSKCITFTDWVTGYNYALPFAEDNGHYPVSRGQRLHGRYIMLFPLAYSSEGQVWLCRDSTDE